MDNWLALLWLLGGVVVVAQAWTMNSQELAWRGVGVLMLVSCVLFVPSWPCFRRNPVVWRGVATDEEGEDVLVAPKGSEQPSKAAARESSKR